MSNTAKMYENNITDISKKLTALIKIVSFDTSSYPAFVISVFLQL